MNKILNTLFILNSICKYDVLDIMSSDINDEEVNNCLFYMCIFLLTEENNPKNQERYQKFLDSFDKLSDSKKQIIIDNFIIIKTQKKK